MNDWNSERVDLLVKLHSEGVRRSLIALKLNELTGSAYTKSSVCGKIDRLFPSPHPRKTADEKLATQQARREREIARKRRLRAKSKPRISVDPNRLRAAKTRVDPGPFVCREAEVVPRHLTLDEIPRGQCRYPFGDEPSDMTFCGHRVSGSSSYCAAHHRLCTRLWVEKVAA